MAYAHPGYAEDNEEIIKTDEKRRDDPVRAKLERGLELELPFC